MSHFRICTLALLLYAAPVAAQLTPDQRVQDFLELAATINRYYAPANWKIDALNVNPLDVSRYLPRIRAVANDAEYYGVAAEYVASFQDGHANFIMPSQFVASLGIGVDVYEGKVLIETIGARYPPSQFSFRVGDELLSIDGVPIGQIVDRLAKLQSSGNERPTRRAAAGWATARSQQVDPLLFSAPDRSTVVIRRAETGAEESYVLTWLKSGQPVINVPRLPDLKLSTVGKPTAGLLPIERLTEQGNRSFMPHLPEISEDHPDEPRGPQALIGLGARTPYYALPTGFVRRRGAGSDFLYSGTFQADGLRIGLIRIPTFLQVPGAQRRAMLRELEGEVRFMQAETDGLIVDASRNSGGYCSSDVLSRLTIQETSSYRDLLLPSREIILFYESVLAEAMSFGAEPWVIDLYRFTLESLRSAAQGVRSLTGPLGSCFTDEFSRYPAEVETYPPWRDQTGSPAGYSKPIVFLQDELSFSQAEHFTALAQDNRRGPIVGVRSPGLGGFVLQGSVGAYGEAQIRVTGGLTVRQMTATAPGLPSAPLIENIGVIPDVVIDSMTRENLMNQFRPFFAQVTQAAVELIRAPKTQ